MSGTELKVDNSDYIELSRLIKSRGLLNKQPAYYTWKILSTLGMLAASLTILALVDTLWLQLLNAAFLAFVFSQIGFIAHDAGHQQIVTSTRKSDFLLLCISFLIALNRSWWLDNHNYRHHSNPNESDIDPDANVPFLALTTEQAISKRGVLRFLVKNQSYLFYPMLSIRGIGLRLVGIQYLLQGKAKHPLSESLVLVAHAVVYAGLLFFLLSPLLAVLFIAVHQLILGLYLGSVDAPNHKGMPILDKDHRMNYLRQQVVTARNIKSNPFTDFYYGGLNHQIEHHLFPNMARNKLGEAQKIVRAFCREHSVPYHEAGVVQSYLEILQSLHRVSAPLRQGKSKSIPAQNVSGT